MIERVAQTIEKHCLAGSENPVLLMVSGGSDSTALAYLACELRHRGAVGPLGILHVNHQLRGEDAKADARFAERLAKELGVTFYLVEVDVGSLAREEGANIEAVARRERYAAAQSALEQLCRSASAPVADGRIFTAHTQDDRVENFYMRSIVGTGPGGFRAMRYANGNVGRPCLDVSKQDLRDYLHRRELDAQVDVGVVLVRDDGDALWREDATNAHTDQFRAYVRANMVPPAKERNPRLLEVLSRSMNLIADEDDMLERMAARILEAQVSWTDAADHAQGCLLAPAFGQEEAPLQRRVLFGVLKEILGPDARIETASIEAIVAGFADGAPISGYTGNIQGNLAISANKRGVLIEPMKQYRSRRKNPKN